VLVFVRFDAARGTFSGDPIPIAQGVGSDGNTSHGAFSVSATGLLAHRSGRGSRHQLVWFDRSGTELGSIGSPDENFMGGPELAPDGRHVAVARGLQGNLDIWLIDTARDVPRRFTFDPGSDGAEVWAPDGSRLMFGSDRNGTIHDLYEKPASGARDEHLVFSSSDEKGADDWSPDGRMLLYNARDTKTHRVHLWALPLEGTPKPLRVVQSKFDDDEGQFSPDGRWIAYRSTESGQAEIYLRSFPGPGGQRQTSVGGGNHPRWPRHGKELFYIAADSKLMAVPIGLPSEGQVLDVGAPVPLFSAHLGAVGLRWQYAVNSDGQRFLMNVVVDDLISPPITIVQNWTAGLKK
jgi:Tol biopolymer transport system component